MQRPLSDPFIAASSGFAGCHRRAPRAGFALVLTLLILCLLIIVVVSYLSSMSVELQTSDAFTAKSKAAQAAQTGVDAATAMLAESFRDFPDSATAWDPQQTANTGTPSNAAIVNSMFNEGASLYLRAMPKNATVSGSSTVVADPMPDGITAPANDPKGNDPNNPGCQNFVLPLISGVPSGYAQLVTSKSANSSGTSIVWPAAMNLAQSDPTQQNWTDLNVRRFSGDLQGIIGSPPEWTTSGTTPTGPKPARAYWVNLTGGDGRLTGRYAFWIDDESFRANLNAVNNAATRFDNSTGATTYPTDPTTNQPYIDRPSDGSLQGIFTKAFDSNQIPDADAIVSNTPGNLGTRALYPGKFMPDPLAFVHPATSTTGAPTFSTPIIDGFRYLTTTQSGSLNLSRHGSQRLNLNTTINNNAVDLSQGVAAQAAIQHQVYQIVQALQFHLPNFGQRFYRTDGGTTGTTLNATQVNPTAFASEGVGDPTQIYLYKVAANIRDYIDNDNQPTLIQAGGTVYPIGVPPLQPFGDTEQPNPMWAVGKEATPFLQESVVRFRPVAPQGDSNGPKGTYTLTVDYYLEFWNPTDHDIAASSLHNPKIHISDQQTWLGYPSGTPLTVSNAALPAPVSPYNDFTINLTGGTVPVVFRAGTATVITTDPTWNTPPAYQFSTPKKTNTGATAYPIYTSDTGVCNPSTTFLCPIIAPGTRTFAGPLPNQTSTTPDYGLYPAFRDLPPPGSSQQDYHTEITFYNDYGYLDCQLFSLAEGGGPIWTSTDKYIGSTGSYNDYSYGGTLYGNGVPSGSTFTSEMGDPRTNNEQMMFHRTTGAVQGDLSRYYNGYSTLGYQNAEYVQPLGGAGSTFSGTYASSSNTFIPWPDYYTWPNIHTDSVALNAQTAPAVSADKPLASIGQLGDVFDPARIASTATSADTARGGGRSFKIGQRDDRVTYDLIGTPTPNNTVNNVPASLGWAAWRLTDIFSAGPVDPTNNYGPTQEPIELLARVNINGVTRDKGAALRALLTGFSFQPNTPMDGSGNSLEPLFHTPANLSVPVQTLATQPTDPTGVSKLVSYMTTRLTNPPPTSTSTVTNVPWGPFFERGELGELEVNGTAIFGKTINPPSTATTSTDLVSGVDMNHTFDHGREELFRRLVEMICTRGDTFTVYAVGQSFTQATTTATPTITGTQRMRVTFRLVPKQFVPNQTSGQMQDFHPAYTTSPLVDGTITGGNDFKPASGQPNDAATVARFAKPDRYAIQVLEVNNF